MRVIFRPTDLFSVQSLPRPLCFCAQFCPSVATIFCSSWDECPTTLWTVLAFSEPPTMTREDLTHPVAAAATTQVKLCPYDEEEPHIWFRLIEAQFAAAGPFQWPAWLYSVSKNRSCQGLSPNPHCDRGYSKNCKYLQISFHTFWPVQRRPNFPKNDGPNHRWSGRCVCIHG